MNQSIEGFAKRAGYELVGEFYDAAVSGADPIKIAQARIYDRPLA
jgi:hypothetical protein